MSNLNWKHWRIDLGGVAVIAGLSAAAYFGLVAPAVAHHQLAQAQSADLIAQQNKTRDMERSLRTLNDQLGSVRSTIEKSRFMLEPPTALNDRLAKITDIAGEHHLQVDAIESGATLNYPRFSTVAIRMSGKGPYRNCAAMLQRVREQMIDVGVTAIQMTSTGIAIDTNANFSIELVWYTQPQQKTPQK